MGKDLRQTFVDLGQRYGPLVWLRVGSENFLLINSIEAASASFLHQGKFYAGRPKKRRTIEVLLGSGRDLVMSDLDSKLQFHRKIFFSFMAANKPFSKERMLPMLEQEGKSLVEAVSNIAVSQDNVDLRLELSRVVANVLSQCILSHRFPKVDDAFHEQLSIIQDILNNIESFNIVDFIPWLENFPIPSWVRFKRSLAKRDEWLAKIIAEHRQNLGDDEAEPCDLLGKMLQMQRQARESEDTSTADMLDDVTIGNIVHELFGGGIESTTSTILWLILYLLHYPKWQKEIVEEINRNDGEPNISKYPVLSAAIKETLRLACVLPIGFPRRTTEHTNVLGYDIPKDTMVFLNTWSIHYDAKYWENPTLFDPGRYLRTGIRSHRSYVPFGVGFRVCVGSRLAKMAIFSFSVQLFSKFEILPSDPDNLPDLNGLPGLTRRPKPFTVKLRNRHIVS